MSKENLSPEEMENIHGGGDPSEDIQFQSQTPSNSSGTSNVKTITSGNLTNTSLNSILNPKGTGKLNSSPINLGNIIGKPKGKKP